MFYLDLLPTPEPLSRHSLKQLKANRSKPWEGWFLLAWLSGSLFGLCLSRSYPLEFRSDLAGSCFGFGLDSGGTYCDQRSTDNPWGTFLSYHTTALFSLMSPIYAGRAEPVIRDIALP